MKKSTLYYIFIALITVAVISIVMLMPYEVNNAVSLKTQRLITKTTVEPKRLYIMAWRKIRDEYIDPEMNGQDWNKWKKRYLPYIKTNEDVYVAINTMLQSLDDPYSRFMNIPEFENQNTIIDSKISGIGINIISIAGKLVISNVIENSPAQKAGLKEGDIIVSINGINTEGISLEEAVKRIRGPEKTPVTIQVSRNGQKIIKDMDKSIIKLRNVKYLISKDNYAYIQITSFMGVSAPQEFQIALNKTKNTKGLILDLRGDAGGLLNNSIIMANMIVNQGRIVSVVYRNGQVINMNAQSMAFYPKKPIVILINKGTASSSEILTGALRDNCNAILVGKNTYGKNSIQKVIPLPNQTGMNLTIAKYLMPNNEDIYKTGIKPDYNVSFTKIDYANNKDPQFQKAKELLKNMMKNNK